MARLLTSSDLLAVLDPEASPKALREGFCQADSSTVTGQRVRTDLPFPGTATVSESTLDPGLFINANNVRALNGDDSSELWSRTTKRDESNSHDDRVLAGGRLRDRARRSADHRLGRAGRCQHLRPVRSHRRRGLPVQRVRPLRDGRPGDLHR